MVAKGNCQGTEEAVSIAFDVRNYPFILGYLFSDVIELQFGFLPFFLLWPPYIVSWSKAIYIMAVFIMAGFIMVGTHVLLLAPSVRDHIPFPGIAVFGRVVVPSPIARLWLACLLDEGWLILLLVRVAWRHFLVGNIGVLLHRGLALLCFPFAGEFSIQVRGQLADVLADFAILHFEVLPLVAVDGQL